MSHINCVSGGGNQQADSLAGLKVLQPLLSHMDKSSMDKSSMDNSRFVVSQIYKQQQ